MIATDDAKMGFKDCDCAMLVGARPRGPGMERKDLLLENAKIFSAQGKASNAVASRDVRVLVVGNPANTNSLIAQRNAPSLNPQHFTAMTRLDHNRAARAADGEERRAVREIRTYIIWGNHSATQYPDLHHATVSGRARAVGGGHGLVRGQTFIPTVQQRGAAVIKARGGSSAASAASAALDHIHDWMLGTPTGDWVSMGIPSDGSYGIPEGVIYSYPVTCKSGEYQHRARLGRRRIQPREDAGDASRTAGRAGRA